YNSKDAVLVAWFAIAMLTLLRYRRERTFGSACLHAVTCAIATDVRLVGLLLPAVTGVLLLVDLSAAGFMAIRRLVRRPIAYGALLAFIVVLSWPQLWENPLHGLADRVGHLRAAAQGDNNMSLYLGEFVQVDQLPWHYLPWWMLITIPVPLTVAF